MKKKKKEKQVKRIIKHQRFKLDPNDEIFKDCNLKAADGVSLIEAVAAIKRNKSIFASPQSAVPCPDQPAEFLNVSSKETKKVIENNYSAVLDGEGANISDKKEDMAKIAQAEQSEGDLESIEGKWDSSHLKDNFFYIL